MTSSRPGLGDLAVVIPVSRPDDQLAGVVEELAAAGLRKIVIVNDGLGGALAQIEGVVIARHAATLGRDTALRTGINSALCEFPGLSGIITADVNSGYGAEHILSIADEFLAYPDSLFIAMGRGSVDFVSGTIIRVLAGRNTADPYSGLRAFPAGFGRTLLHLTSPDGQFDIEMLVSAREQSLAVREHHLPASPAQKTSKYRGLWGLLLRLGSIHAIAALLNIVVFALAYHRKTRIFVPQVMGWTAGTLFYYAVSRKADFNRYLRVAALSGAVSYGLLRLVAGSTSFPVVRTKGILEALLLVVAYALQREWTAPVPIARFGVRQTLWWLLLLIPVGIEISGFRSAHLLSMRTWNDEGQIRFEHYTLFFAAVTAAFALFARRWFLPALTGSTLLCSAFAVGAIPVIAVLLFVFSATIVGRLVFGGSLEAPLAFPAGIAVWIVAMYSTSFLTIHYPAVYVAALAIPILAAHGQSRTLAREWADVFRPGRTNDFAEMAACAAAGFVLLANWLVVLKPEASMDGLTTHLAVPANIALRHAFTIDFHQFIWALMPLGTDFCYSVVYVIGGEYAARLLNFGILILIAILLFREASAFVSKPVAGLLTALFISTPMVYLATGSLFVENFVAAMVLSATVALWRFHNTASPRYLLLAAILFGTSTGLKLGAATAGVTGLAMLLFQLSRSKMRHRLALGFAAMLLFFGAGGIPYAKAYALSGNPLFPFQTRYLHSPLITDDLRDERFKQKPDWRIPARITFHTDRFYEGQAGSFGLQYLLFLPLTLGVPIAVGYRSRKRAARKGGYGGEPTAGFLSAAAVGIGGISILIIGITQPNARYFYLAMPLLTIGMASALGWLRAQHRLVFQASVCAALAAGFWNVRLLPTADWANRDFYSAPLFSAEGRDAFMRRIAPEREVFAWLNRTDTANPVVITDGAEIAGLQMPVHTNAWLDYSFIKQVQASSRPVDVYRLFKRFGFAHMVVDKDNAARQQSVSEVIARCGSPEFTVNQYAAMKLRPDCESVLETTPNEYGSCTPREPLPRGKQDETDWRIALKGPWTTERTYQSSYRRTISYSSAPGAQICLSMEGTRFDYIYTRAFNRGHAEVVVDGARKALVDLYSKKVEWQSRSSIDGLGPGRHEVTIRVLGEKNPDSTGYYVDVDAIQVY